MLWLLLVVVWTFLSLHPKKVLVIFPIFLYLTWDEMDFCTCGACFMKDCWVKKIVDLGFLFCKTSIWLKYSRVRGESTRKRVILFPVGYIHPWNSKNPCLECLDWNFDLWRKEKAQNRQASSRYIEVHYIWRWCISFPSRQIPLHAEVAPNHLLLGKENRWFLASHHHRFPPQKATWMSQEVRING